MSKSRYIKNLVKEKKARATRPRWTVQPRNPLTDSATESKYGSMSRTSMSGSSGSPIPNSSRNFSLSDTLDSGSSPVWRNRKLPLGLVRSSLTGSRTKGARRVSDPLSTHSSMPSARKRVFTPCSWRNEFARRYVESRRRSKSSAGWAVLN